MSKTKTAEEKAAAKAEKEAAKAAALAEKELGGASPKKNASSVDIIDTSGVIRTYSEKEHGERFREYADEFAGKKEGRKVVAHE